MGIVAVVAAVFLVGGLLANSPAQAQTLPPQQDTTTPPQPDCGCGVPASPRGPR
jgi:hypothetical protein